MKVRFNRSALAEALALVTSVVPSRTPKPILRCVRITAAEKDAHICATNLETGLDYAVSEVEIEQAGEIVVDAERLAAIVRESTDDVLVVESRDSTCEVTGSDSHFTIYGQDPQHYPPVAAMGDDQGDLGIELTALQAGIAQVLFAAARESSRYAINGVLWEVKGKKLTLVATDGRRLARCRVDLTAAGGRLAAEKIILPARTMALVEKLVAHGEEKVAVHLAGNQVLIRCSHALISSSLVDGNFPKYEDIIPADYDKKLRLPVEGVLSAARRAALVTSEESKGIRLSLGDGKITFSGSSPETGAAEIKMPASYKGEPMDIGFNPQFLVDALRVVREPEFDMELGQPDRPGVLKSGPDFLYVLMPINLS